MTAALINVSIIVFVLVLFLISAIKVAREYERGIVFRLGRLFPHPIVAWAANSVPCRIRSICRKIE